MSSGQVRPANLYDHNKAKYKGVWFRYRLPENLSPTFFTIKQDFDVAVQLAKKLNAKRDQLTQPIIDKLREEFEGAELRKPELKNNSVTKNLLEWRETLSTTDPVRYNAIREDTEFKKHNDWQNWLIAKRFGNFCDSNSIQLAQVDAVTVLQFWQSLSAEMQRKHIVLRRFLNWCLANKKCPHLKREDYRASNAGGILEYTKKDTSEERHRLKDMSEFWAIYNEAGKLDYSFIQHAMLLGLFTTLRESDIITLRRDNGGYTGDLLRKSILKSHNAKGEALGSNLFWDLNKHQDLAALLTQLEARSKSMGDCPFFVCHKFHAKRGNKEHRSQVLPSFLQHSFAEVRDATGLWSHLQPVQRPGFNQIRSLASRLCEETFAYPMKDISEGMAHTDPHNRREGAPITYLYTSVGYPLKWTESNLVIRGDEIGFSEHYAGIEIKEVRDWAGLSLPKLQELLWTYPVRTIVKEYDCSEWTLKRTIRDNNLIQPKPGFWMKVTAGKVQHPQGQIFTQYAN